MAWAVPCKGCTISSFPNWTLPHFNSKPENRSKLPKRRSSEEADQAGNTQAGCGMGSGMSPEAEHGAERGSLSPLPLVPISVLAVPLPFHPLWEPRATQTLPSLCCPCPALPWLWFPPLCSPPLVLSLVCPASPDSRHLPALAAAPQGKMLDSEWNQWESPLANIPNLPHLLKYLSH